MATDSSQLIENNVAVTDSLLYTVKHSAVRCRQYRASIPSSNGVTFQPQTTAIFYVPARTHCFLSGQETCLKFAIKYVNTANLTPYTDGYGSSVINRIDIFHGSNLLESIQNANVLYSLMFDAVLDPAQRIGLGALYGGSTDITNPRLGQKLTSTSSAYSQLTCCIPLLSSVCGLGLDKYLPLGLSDDIRIEVTFESNNAGLVKSGTTADTYISGFSTDWVVQSPEMVCCIIELDAQGMALVNSVAPPSGETVLHGTSWRAYNSSMPSNTSGGSFSTLVPARFASMNSILLAPRLSSTTVLSTGYSISSRINPNLNQYYWRIGGAITPQKPVLLSNTSSVGGYGEALFEFIKCFHTVNTPMSGSCLRADYYNVAKTATTQYGAVTAGATDHTSAFAIGQEFTTFSGRTDVLLCGANTLSSNIFFEAEVSSSGNDAMVLNFFANYDILFVIQDGLISARF
jgi:hypothetical protein